MKKERGRGGALGMARPSPFPPPGALQGFPINNLQFQLTLHS